MKRIQWGSTKCYRLLILTLIVTMALASSCAQEETAGRHSAKFIFRGTVLSANDSLPLKGVHVKMMSDTTGMDSTMIANLPIYKDSAITDQNGNFEVVDLLGIPAEISYELAFIDTGKTLKNSAERIDTSVTYTFLNPEFTNGDGHWYTGETFQTDTFRLKIAE